MWLGSGEMGSWNCVFGMKSRYDGMVLVNCRMGLGTVGWNRGELWDVHGAEECGMCLGS